MTFYLLMETNCLAYLTKRGGYRWLHSFSHAMIRLKTLINIHLVPAKFQKVLRQSRGKIGKVWKMSRTCSENDQKMSSKRPEFDHKMTGKLSENVLKIITK